MTSVGEYNSLSHFVTAPSRRKRKPETPAADNTAHQERESLIEILIRKIFQIGTRFSPVGSVGA